MLLVDADFNAAYVECTERKSGAFGGKIKLNGTDVAGFISLFGLSHS